MSTVEEIKVAIEGLSLSDRGKLERWLHSWADDSWDQQISEDAATGRLDKVLLEVDREAENGELQDLP